MPDQKITQLVDGGAPQATDEFVVARAGDNFKIDAANLYTVGGTDVAVADGGTGSSTAAGARTALDVPSNAEAVLDTLFDANTVLAADTDNTPAALTMGASTILARLAAGNIKAATPAEIRTLIGVQPNKHLCYGNSLVGLFSSSGAIVVANRAQGWRAVAEKTGTITAAYLLVQVSSGNIEAGILDTSPTTRNRLWTTGSIACPAANSWASLGNPNLAVTTGDSFDLYINADSTTATFGRYTVASTSAIAASMPSDLFTGPLVPGATKNFPAWQRSTSEFPIAATVAETTLAQYIFSFALVFVIT